MINVFHVLPSEQRNVLMATLRNVSNFSRLKRKLMEHLAVGHNVLGIVQHAME